MDFLLSTSIDFVVVGFTLVVVLDFVTGLRQLWADSQPKEVYQSEMAKPYPQVEDGVNASACQTETLLKPLQPEELPTEIATPTLEVALQPELAAMPNTSLRKLCSQRGIKWRNAYGTNKHLTKPQMIDILIRLISVYT